MRFSIRSRLLAVAMLGVLTCALALYALFRPLAAADSQRDERARDGVAREVERLVTEQATSDARPRSAMFGMRSGYLGASESFDDMQPPLDPEAPRMLREAVAQSKRSRDLVALSEPVPTGTLFVSAAPTPEGDIAWAAFVMKPPRWTPLLHLVGALLVVASIALVLASIHAVVSVTRGATALTDSLAALGKDLSAPIAQPAVRELGDVAQGIVGLARELARAQRELTERERLAVLGRVSAGVAHELRNPLASIKLRIDLARRRHDMPAGAISELSDVAEEIARLDRLANDLLTVAGRRTGPRSPTELGALARRRVELMATLAGDRGVTVRVEGDGAAAIDPDAIARVVDNLVRNAIDASPPNGVVSVEIASDVDGVHARFRDQGAGVPTDRDGELFEPFFTTKPNGVGLGLALSHAIACAHGGTLNYHREGTMTVFELFLPAREAA